MSFPGNIERHKSLVIVRKNSVNDENRFSVMIVNSKNNKFSFNLTEKLDKKLFTKDLQMLKAKIKDQGQITSLEDSFSQLIKHKSKENIISKNIFNNNFLEKEAININKVSNSKQREYAFTFITCVICDLCYASTRAIKFNCKHGICFTCCKLYFEDSIESGDFASKCPVYHCKTEFENKILNGKISEIHLEKMLANSSNLSDNITVAKNMENLKIYASKNVLDVTKPQTIFEFSQNKNKFCKSCSEPSLFKNLQANALKCLNCFNNYCIFCFQRTDSLHLLYNTANPCKIYFKKKQV